MAVDLLSRGTQTPILVGDWDDLVGFQRCFVVTDSSPRRLELFHDGQTSRDIEQRRSWELTDAAASDLLHSEFVLIVSLTINAETQVDEIGQAILSPLNDRVSPLRKLSEAELLTLAEALVAGDFHLQLLTPEEEPAGEAN